MPWPTRAALAFSLLALACKTSASRTLERSVPPGTQEFQVAGEPDFRAYPLKACLATLPCDNACGSEIIERLERTLNHAWKTFQNTGYAKHIRCENPVGMMKSWDIYFDLGDGATCSMFTFNEGITVNGVRQWLWDVNYAIFGLASRLCTKTWAETWGLARSWKAAKGEWTPFGEYWLAAGWAVAEHTSVRLYMQEHPLPDNPMYSHCRRCPASGPDRGRFAYEFWIDGGSLHPSTEA